MKNEHDVIIIGGGINGAGVARDCALRGINAALFEKHDIAHGASGNNTGMIHGGIRYLRYDISTTKASCTDAGYIQKICPHLLFRVPFLFPVLKGDAAGHWLLEGAEIFFEAYDVFQPLKGGKKHTRLTAKEARALEPGLTEDVIGAVTMDEWGIDAHRLTLSNLIQATELGSQIHTYTPFVDFTYDARGIIHGVKVFDSINREFQEHRAPVVVNATGAWGPRVAALTKIPYRLRQGKGVHVVYGHRISNYGMVMKAVDGRQMFFLPHENNTIIGTTDDDYYSDLDNPTVTEDEIKYIVESARHVFPSIDKYRKTSTYVGVRPTIFAWGKNEDKLSREHGVIDHGEDGFPGLYSVTGGKLAAYRQLSEEVTDVVAKHVCNKAPCSTHSVPLPGAEEKLHVPEWTNKYHLPQIAVSRMAYRHGSRAQKILDAVQENPRLQHDTCLCEPVLEAEICQSLRSEHVQKTSDVCRRTKLGKGVCGGAHCMGRLSQIVARERNLAASRQLVELGEALDEKYESRRTVLSGSNLASEELNRGVHLQSYNLLPFLAIAKAQLKDQLPLSAPDEPADSARTQVRHGEGIEDPSLDELELKVWA